MFTSEQLPSCQQRHPPLYQTQKHTLVARPALARRHLAAPSFDPSGRCAKTPDTHHRTEAPIYGTYERRRGRAKTVLGTSVASDIS